jgi:hypothetical protein
MQGVLYRPVLAELIAHGEFHGDLSEAECWNDGLLEWWGGMQSVEWAGKTTNRRLSSSIIPVFH